jgi:ankyrin repeat protein
MRSSTLPASATDNDSIYHAVKSGDIANVKRLVEAGAEILPTDANDPHFKLCHTLRAAVADGRTEILQYLLSKVSTAHKQYWHYISVNEILLTDAAACTDTRVMQTLADAGITADIEGAIRLLYKNYLQTLVATPRRHPEAKADYTRHLKNLLNYAAGTDLKINADYPDKKSREHTNLSQTHDFTEFECFENIDLTGMNLAGVSLGGQDISHAMLDEAKLLNADAAIITPDDIARMPDTDPGKAIIQKQLVSVSEQRGGFIRNGMINLTPLWRAAQIGDKEAVADRLQAGVDPNETRPHTENEYALYLAAKAGHESIVTLLLQSPKIDKRTLPTIIADLRRDKNPKSEASQQLIINTLDINQANKAGYTPLHLAIQAYDAALITELIQKGADVNQLGPEGTPLHMVCSLLPYDETHVIVVETILAALLKANANPNVRWSFDKTEPGRTPLELTTDKLRCMKLLLPRTDKSLLYRGPVSEVKNAAPTRPWYGYLLFFSLLHSDGIEMALLLESENKAPLDFTICFDSREKSTVLHCLCEQFANHPSYNLIERINYVIAQGATVTALDAKGNTPLHRLLESEMKAETTLDGMYALIIDQCITKGFPINRPNKQDITLLDLATANANDAAIAYLKSRGATPYPNYNKMTSPLAEEKSAATEKVSIPNSSNVTDAIKTRRHDNFSPETLAYLLEQTKKPANAQTLKQFSLSPAEKARLPIYCDTTLMKKNQIMNAPVLLNHRLYDLSTILKLTNDGTTTGIDPYTLKAFTLADLKPAKETAQAISQFIATLKTPAPIQAVTASAWSFFNPANYVDVSKVSAWMTPASNNIRPK